MKLLGVLRDNYEYMGRKKLNRGKNLYSIIELTLTNSISLQNRAYFLLDTK